VFRVQLNIVESELSVLEKAHCGPSNSASALPDGTPIYESSEYQPKKCRPKNVEDDRHPYRHVSIMPYECEKKSKRYRRAIRIVEKAALDVLVKYPELLKSDGFWKSLT